ncbi:GntR family transcriptional regulator [Qaidamihabitans albus]|uniref:GntR family transcriptional regulator n=1 Tax=Qaidamihabitans albus TaxID=2795733 RepID=UPI0018F19E90|nr:GntR family transcriptional regulator [Qaidamihabitans albus]
MARNVNAQEDAGGRDEPRSLFERAYVAIRDQLITNQIRPGAPVREDQLSRQLGVGRTPVREAIKRLETERLVNVYPRRGVFATDVHITDLSLLTEVRTQLEGQAALLAAARATRAEREELRHLLGEIAQRGRSAVDQIEVDSTVHRTISQCAHNPFLEASLAAHYNLILRIWHLFIDRLPEITDHVAELVPVVNAVVDGDGERARKLVIEHVIGFERAVMSTL